MKDSLLGYFSAVIAGFVSGLALSAVMHDHAIVASYVSTLPSASASATRIYAPRVEWCVVSSYSSVAYDNDPLGPLPTRWALDGYFASGVRKTVDTGDTSEEMVARAKELGCPLHEAPSP